MPSPTESKRIFLVTAILVVLLAGIFLLRWQKKPTLPAKEEKRSAIEETEKMIIPSPTVEELIGVYTVVTSEKTVKVGGNFTATVSFKALGSRLDGADVILRFDPDYLVANPTLSFGDYFTLYPRKEVNNEKGFIKVTGIEPKADEVNAVLTPLFNASFGAKKAGTTTLSFDFQKGATNKTTLVEKESSKNILGSVNEASLTIEP